MRPLVRGGVADGPREFSGTKKEKRQALNNILSRAASASRRDAAQLCCLILLGRLPLPPSAVLPPREINLQSPPTPPPPPLREGDGEKKQNKTQTSSYTISMVIAAQIELNKRQRRDRKSPIEARTVTIEGQTLAAGGGSSVKGRRGGVEGSGDSRHVHSASCQKA